MKIVHICLANFYVEGMGYQENLLPKHHVLAGHEVTVLTNDFTFGADYKPAKRKEREYKSPDGMHVRVLSRSNRYGFYSTFGDYEKVYESLEEEKPDIIFVHGGQFVSLREVIKYCKRHRKAKLYIDQHGDYYNSPVAGIKGVLRQRVIYGHWIRKAQKYAECYWGVTPWRCKYLNEVYNIPKEKIDLLIMGADDEKIRFSHKNEIRAAIEKKYGIKKGEFLVVTGGKINKAKNILNLMRACEAADGIKLLVFGSVLEDVKEEFEAILEQSKKIIYIGWVDSSAVYDYFLAADLVAFPGTHSVLWEQACACKVPALFMDWDGMRHVNQNGNAILVKDISSIGLKKELEALKFTEQYFEMKKCAESSETDIFLYSHIAKKAIGNS